jgi:hypothetical protein
MADKKRRDLTLQNLDDIAKAWLKLITSEFENKPNGKKIIRETFQFYLDFRNGKVDSLAFERYFLEGAIRKAKKTRKIVGEKKVKIIKRKKRP